VLLILGLAAMALIAVPRGAGADFTFANFTSLTGMVLNGSATQISGDRIRVSTGLRQKGSAWYATKQDVEDGFETNFQFQITGPGTTGADGLVFVIQNSAAGTGALGGLGDAIGYGSQSGAPNGIANSIGVEFDTWNNGVSFGDPNGNHLAVHRLSATTERQTSSNQLGVTTAIPTLEDGQVHSVKVTYEPGTLRVFLDNLVTPALTVSVDLATAITLDDGKAWVGFTSGTGAATGNHFILNWSFVAAVEDEDGDGIADGEDNCPSVPNPNQLDTDGDGAGDACDSDDDNDGVADGTDNCAVSANADQADLDGDEIGDVCDAENTVQVDVKPNDKLNTFGCKSEGMIQVAVLSTRTFKAADIDPGTVRFGLKGNEAGIADLHQAAKAKDVNKDGMLDMVFEFRFSDAGIACAGLPTGKKQQSMSAMLTGETQVGTPITGGDVLRLAGSE
jgi:hypothetical protein